MPAWAWIGTLGLVGAAVIVLAVERMGGRFR